MVQHVRQVVPVTFFATFLNAPCTSLRLAQAGPESTIYLVVGKSNGETIFFPTDRSECITKFENEAKVPICAIADGDFRNRGRSELVTITANGNLTSLSFPCGAPTGPVRLFAQQLYANICSAELVDIDADGLVELVVVMTDRVVRSYRFVEELDRVVPLNKWEMPAQISGWSIGAGCATNFALLSQSEEHHYIRLDFGPGKDVRVHPAPPSRSAAAPSPCPEGAQSTATAPHQQLPLTQLVIVKHLCSVHLLHCMVQRLLMVDDAHSQQLELANPGGADVACCYAAIFPNGLRTLTTCDPWGLLNVYAWRDEDELEKVAAGPVASCRVMRDVDFISTCPGPRKDDDRLFVGVVNIFSRIAIFSLDLTHILHYQD